MIHYNKLIRDNIPEQLQKQGKKISYHQAQDEKEVWYLLMSKIQEELNEFNAKPTIDTYVDILDVVDEIARVKKFDLQEVKARREQKFSELGAFEKHWVVEASEVPLGERQEQGI
jgi:predicted house-cleaning noncanonical NTP pyrophosphatase (MazG superfamily)